MIYIRLKEVRQNAGLTQRELSKMTSIAEPKLSLMENNRSEYLYKPHLERIVEVLNISFDEILEIK